MTPIEAAIDSVGSRRWEYVVDSWFDAVPTIMVPGTAPETCILDLPDFQLVVAKLNAQFVTNKEYLKTFNKSHLHLFQLEEEISGLRSVAFHETLYMFHKARHILGAAENHANLGIKTWSLSASYHGSFLAARVILGLLGVYTINLESKTVMIDIFSKYDKSRGVESFSSPRFTVLSKRFDHAMIWNLFQRVMAVSVVEKAIWPRNIQSKLKSVRVDNFAKQRNFLYYDGLGWIYDDLHKFDLITDYGTTIDWNSTSEDIDFDRRDISTVVCYYLLRLALCLLRDVSSRTEKLKGELALLRECLCESRHPIDRDLLSQELVPAS